MPLPTKVVGGYFPTSGPTSHPLRDVHANYNVVYAAFAKGTNTTSGTLHVITPTQGLTSFNNDIDTLQARGVKVMLSIGGSVDIENGGVLSQGYHLYTPTQEDEAYDSLKAIITASGYDGIDWDLEAPDGSFVENDYNFAVDSMVSVTQRLLVDFPNLIVTLAPEYFDANRSGSQYRAVADALGSDLDAIAPQFYNHGVNESQSLNDILTLSRTLITAYGASKVMIGTMNHDDSHSDTNNVDTNNTITITTEKSAWNTLVAESPTLRGMFIWTTYFDKVNATNGAWAFATQVGPLILGGPTPGSDLGRGTDTAVVSGATKIGSETGRGTESASVSTLGAAPPGQEDPARGTEFASVVVPLPPATPTAGTPDTLVVDGIDLKSLNISVLKIDYFSPLRRRGEDTVVPGRRGKLGSTKPLDAYSFSVEVYVAPRDQFNNYSDYGNVQRAQMVENFRSLLRTLGGSGGVVALERHLGTGSGTAYVAHEALGEFVSVNSWELINYSNGKAELEFINLDGCWYDMAYTTIGTGSNFIDGDIDTDRILATLPGAGTLSNATTGTDVTVSAATTLSVSAYSSTAGLSVVTSSLGNKWLTLKPGLNQITWNGSGTAQISYKAAWA